MSAVGKSILRVEGRDKVTGAATYVSDHTAAGLLHARTVISPYAHAKIIAIDTEAARRSPGVRAVLTGRDAPVLTGPSLADRPILAIDRVRYYGEPVAAVVADSEHEAKRAAELIKVEYEPLPVVNSPSAALRSDAPLIHEQLGKIHRYAEVYPVPGTNIANLTKIRKGDMQKGWSESEVVAEAELAFSQSDHAAMEPRGARVEILPDGRVVIHTSSQTPFVLKRLFNRFFGIDMNQVIVHVPLVGGAFGGKGAAHLEYIAYIASRGVGGRPVKIVYDRERDMLSAPVHIGLESRVKLGCTREGKLTAAEITHLFDGGAYSEEAVIISKAGAVDCTGPYRIDNVKCDSLCLYTNHPYATSFRGFGHPELTFAVERVMDMLAKKLNMDPLELRLKNAILPGDSTPTQVLLNRSNIGNLPECITRLRKLIDWDEGQRIETGDRKVRAKGMSCLWKTSNSPTDAGSGAIITFNADGTMNLNVGSIELGQGNRTVLAQILAERMKVDADQVHVRLEIDTQVSPEHWKTVASSGTMMVGHAVLDAAEDAIRQLKQIASIALKVMPEDVEIGGGRAFLREDPRIGIPVKDIALGYKYPDGNAVGGPVIGRGNYIMKHLTPLDPETGKGRTGPQWTVGAQAVEVEFDTREYTYRIVRAATVIDAGKVINPATARGQMTGGMSMGLSFASRESFLFTGEGIVQNPNFRSYKLIRYGEHPEYLVEFVETPFADGPYGARGIGEYGVIGMPAALANSLSVAVQAELNRLPLVPEYIWRRKTGGSHDLV